MGGLFSTAGPPLVYHLYRQPLPVAVIRETLVAVFGINAVLRLALVAGSGNIRPLRPGPVYWQSRWSGLAQLPPAISRHR